MRVRLFRFRTNVVFLMGSKLLLGVGGVTQKGQVPILECDEE